MQAGFAASYPATLRKTLIALALGLLAVLIVASPALAGRTWCRTDPDVVLEGTQVQVVVSVPQEYLSLVNGPTLVKFNLPSDVDRQLVFADSGFNNLGYDVQFSAAFQPGKFNPKFSVNLTVKVPISNGTKVPILVEVYVGGAYYSRVGNDAKTGTSVNFTVYGTP